MARSRPPERPVALAVSALVVGVAMCSFVIAKCRVTVRPEDAADGWPLARATLTNGESCFAGRAEYCLTDPELVDGAIRPRLDELYGGEMPPRKMHVDAVIRAAVIVYKRTIQRPENVAKVEELVRERYLNPRIASKDGVVSVDMGVLPGRLEPHPATMALRLAHTDLVTGADWERSELERVVIEHVQQYPDASVVRVAVTLPWGEGMGIMSFRWIAAERRLVVTAPTEETRTTRRLKSVADLRDPMVKLAFAELAPCAKSRTPSPPEEDPPHLCPPDEDPTARAAASGP